MKEPEIVVIDYGMGNLRSVSKALERVGGARVTVSGDSAIIKKAGAVVFPGVGAFAPAIAHIKKSGIRDAIDEVIAAGKPFLGLCLGFQLLFSSSSEGGLHNGLKVIPGKVERFSARRGLKIPHMGWNRVSIANPALKKTMFKGIKDGSWFYFVHSYYGKPAERKHIAATTEYGKMVCAAVASGSTWGCQFHPEKSGETGLVLLRNFILEVRKCS